MAGKKVIEKAQAVLAVIVEQADEDGRWAGSLTQVVKDADGVSYYSQIRRVLMRSGAIEQESRGGGGMNSVWIVRNAEADLFDVAIHRDPLQDKDSRLDRIERLIGGVDVPAAIASLALDIAFLKKTVIGEGANDE